VSTRISYVNAGDFDGDGRQELLGKNGAACGATSTYFVVFKNLSSPGTLAFSSEVDITSVAGLCFYNRSVITDLNNDNKLDIAVTRGLFSESSSVILNQSTPGVIDINTFAQSPDLINGGNTIALSDFDGDDLPELITHNEGNNTGIALRPNTSTSGAISFADSIPYFSNIFREGETSISDINGDAKKDIIIAADWSQNWVSILENNFNGTLDESSFKLPVRLVTNTIFPKTLDVGDLNHDGKPDIVTGNQNAFLSILENAVQFPPKITNVSTYQAQVGASITIEGQYFSTTPSENKVRFGSVFANVISATSTELVAEVPQGAAYDHITVGVDIFTAISLRKFSLSTGPGADFDASSFAPPFSIAASGDVVDLVAGDLDNDGKIDLMAREGSSRLILKNQSTSDVLDAASFQIIPSSLSHLVTPSILTDLNGDGYLDLFGTGRVLFNNSNSGTEPIEFLDQITSFSASGAIQLKDLNQDGILDNVAPNSSVVTINEGLYTTVSFPTVCCPPNIPFASNINLTKPGGLGQTAVADYDGDGFLDIAASNPNADNVSFFRNLGFEDVITASDFTTAENFSVGDNPIKVASGDLDLDGKIDLAVINQNDNTVSVLHNQSTIGNFNFDLYSYSVTASPRLLRVHDLDGDSKPEIITINAFVSGLGATFSILKNNTASMDASSFAEEQFYSRSNNAVPSDFEIADLDEDGRADLILTSSDPDELVIYKNLVSSISAISISSQPTDDSSCEGTNATFSVSAAGTSNITYQWQEDQGSGFSDLTDGNGVSGSATSTLSLTGVTNAKNGFFYRCVISGDFVTDVVSNEVQIQVLEQASISTQPQDQTVNIGQNATLSTTATGDDLSYQWFKDGIPLNNENDPSLIINSATISDQGLYSCVVENSCNSITSNEVSLIVSDPNSGFSVTDGSQNQTINNGQQAVISFDPAVVGATTSRTFTINNTGQTDIMINSIIVSGDDDVFVLGAVPSEVVVGSSESFKVVAESQVTGLFTASVQIETSIGDFIFPISVEFSDQPQNGSLIVYNAVAPSGNGKHDFLKIENIELFASSSVQIFNRWGDKVYEAIGYDNQSVRFEGVGNVGASKELVEGTYFYVIKTEVEQLTGYLFLRR